MRQAINKPWIVDTKHRGSLNGRTVAIVMNNSADRNNVNKIRVSYFITENPELLQGNNTVAVFRLKKQASIFSGNTAILDELPAGSKFRTNEYGQLLVKHDDIPVDGKTTSINPFGQAILIDSDQLVIVEEKKPKTNDLNVTNLFTNYLNKKKEPLV